MRRIFAIAAVLGLAGAGVETADADDAHAEMAAALAAQADLHPSPVALPTRAAAPLHAAAPSAVKRGVDPRAAAAAAAANERGAEQARVHATQSLAHQTQAAAAQAAGQTQAQAAKQRVDRPRPAPHR